MTIELEKPSQEDVISLQENLPGRPHRFLQKVSLLDYVQHAITTQNTH